MADEVPDVAAKDGHSRGLEARALQAGPASRPTNRPLRGHPLIFLRLGTLDTR